MALGPIWASTADAVSLTPADSVLHQTFIHLPPETLSRHQRLWLREQYLFKSWSLIRDSNLTVYMDATWRDLTRHVFTYSKVFNLISLFWRSGSICCQVFNLLKYKRCFFFLKLIYKMNLVVLLVNTTLKMDPLCVIRRPLHPIKNCKLGFWLCLSFQTTVPFEPFGCWVNNISNKRLYLQPTSSIYSPTCFCPSGSICRITRH